jgi:hypothetical protein
MDDPAPRRAFNWILRVTRKTIVAQWPVQQPFAQNIAGLRAVKHVTLSLFTSSFTQVFTLWPRILLTHGAMRETQRKNSIGKTTKTGGSHFFGFQPPKKFVGSSRPLPQDAAVTLSRPQAIVPNRSKAHIATRLLQSWQSSGRIYFRFPATQFSFPTLSR